MADQIQKITPEKIVDLSRALLEEVKLTRAEREAYTTKKDKELEESRNIRTDLEKKVRDLESQKAGVENRRVWLEEQCAKLQERVNELEEELKQYSTNQKKDTSKIRLAVEKRTNKIAGDMALSIGATVEKEIFPPDVLAGEFKKILGHELNQKKSRVPFHNQEPDYNSDIDVQLGDGSTVILVETKTTLESSDVLAHVERLKQYRRYIDTKSPKNRIRIIGAVAGLHVNEDVIQVAFDNKLYGVIKTDKGVELASFPEGFQPKKW